MCGYNLRWLQGFQLKAHCSFWPGTYNASLAKESLSSALNGTRIGAELLVHDNIDWTGLIGCAGGDTCAFNWKQWAVTRMHLCHQQRKT